MTIPAANDAGQYVDPSGAPLYTLDEAVRAMSDRACASGRHAPSTEAPELGDTSSTWLCRCGLVTYTPSTSPTSTSTSSTSTSVTPAPNDAGLPVTSPPAPEQA